MDERRYYIVRQKAYRGKRACSIYHVRLGYGKLAGPFETIGSFWTNGEVYESGDFKRPPGWGQRGLPSHLWRLNWQETTRLNVAWTILSHLHGPEVANKHAEALHWSMPIPRTSKSFTESEIFARLVDGRRRNRVMGVDLAAEVQAEVGV